jgi:hypothetical protein
MKWHSIRNKYPEEEGTYRIKDCQNKAEGKAFYDGFEWKTLEIEPKSGSLLLPSYKITHWLEEDITTEYPYDDCEITPFSKDMLTKYKLESL